ncbi:MAG: alkaline phosphatase family protein, partial [Archaeoglobaceae archaeon]
KAFVIGLDSAPPELLFQEFVDDLPHVRSLLKSSIYGSMKSCIPAITIPAWMVMATGKSPGELGLYGFRHRKSGSYTNIWIAHSLMVKEKAVWDYLGEKGKKSILVGVPPSYPPKPINGHMVSCFITPDSSVNYTYPPDLKSEIEDLVGNYIFDADFRKEDRDQIIRETWEMTEKRFEVIRYLLQEKEWDYFQLVEIGLDRIHHAFWRYFDEEHHLHQKGKYQNVIKDYYQLVDKEVGKTMKLLDDDTAVAIVSDHGIKRMDGCFTINQWLIEQGLLAIKNPEIMDNGPVKFEQLDIDWDNTLAWAWGGYYSRVFLNVEGREENGVIKSSDYHKVREEIAHRLKSIRGPNGEEWDTRVYYPEDIYPEVKGDIPDMLVYMDGLSWRSAGTLGYETNYLRENDVGPDDAVHSEYGCFALYMPGMEAKRVDTTIYDFAPTMLRLFGIENLGIQNQLRGRSII